MENHLYEGTFSRCTKCMRPKSHAIHGVVISAVIVSNSSDVPSAIRINTEAEETIATYDEEGKKNGERTVKTTVQVVIPQTAECKGHSCSRCGNQIQHDYPCYNEDKFRLCQACAMQSSIVISRPDTVKQLDKDYRPHVENAKLVESREGHRETCNKWIFRDPQTGKMHEDWRDRGERHLNDLLQQIEFLKSKTQGYALAYQDTVAEEICDMTPEERIKWEKNAVKNRKPKETKAPKAKKEKAKEDIYGKIVSDLKLSDKTLTPEEIKKRAADKAVAEIMARLNS